MLTLRIALGRGGSKRLVTDPSPFSRSSSQASDAEGCFLRDGGCAPDVISSRGLLLHFPPLAGEQDSARDLVLTAHVISHLPAR